MLNPESRTEDLRPRLSRFVGASRDPFDQGRTHVVGVLPGEGVGPEIVPVALGLLGVLERHSRRRFELRTGGAIGCEAKARYGSSLSDEVVGFAGEVFADGGALFCGPGGERFVYELRRVFRLYCKFTPIEPLPELAEAGVVRPETVSRTDMIAVRENMGGCLPRQLVERRWR